MTNPQQPSPQPAQPQGPYTQAPQQQFPAAQAAAPVQFSARQKFAGAVVLTLILTFIFRFLTWFVVQESGGDGAKISGTGSIEIMDRVAGIDLSLDAKMLGLYSSFAVLALVIALVCGLFSQSFLKYSKVLAFTAAVFYVAVPTLTYLIAVIALGSEDVSLKPGSGLIIVWIAAVIGFALYAWLKFGQNLGAKEQPAASQDQWAYTVNQQWGAAPSQQQAGEPQPEANPWAQPNPRQPNPQQASEPQPENNPWTQLNQNDQQAPKDKPNNPWA